MTPDTDLPWRVAALRAHRLRQQTERQALEDLAGPGASSDHGLVFTKPNGQPLHPQTVTEHFKDLADQAGLLPIRLHDLRHAAATVMLAAGIDNKFVQELLGYSDRAITSDTYTSVLPALAAEAITAAADVINQHRRTPTGTEPAAERSGRWMTRSRPLTWPPLRAQWPLGWSNTTPVGRTTTTPVRNLKAHRLRKVDHVS
ncbi:tyrosine-type recombinase/integrase [Actinomadura sp. 6N118]|uniref:tyrosine-type recombinase/integrase n=1 Tax=Actinomadura sp. 6N118 TaxID=3375151 RepID=UPI0037BC48E9